MKPPVKPYKAKVYRIPAKRPAVKMRPKTASEEIAEIESGQPPPAPEYAPEEPSPKPSWSMWWERVKAAWRENLRN